MSLKDLYYNPKTGFTSSYKLYKKARENNINVSQKDVKEFLDKQYTSQITKQVNKPKIFSSIYSDKPRDEYQMDIMIYDRYEFNKYKYIFVVVDIHSRYAEARAMTNRRNETIMTNLKDIIQSMGKPKKISCDNEFNTKEFEKYCNESNIQVNFSEPNDIQKNSIVERLNRTIALLLQKCRVATNNYDWKSYLQDIMFNYNHSYHRTIKNTPDNILNKNGKNKQTVYVVIPKFCIGDKVRIKEIKHIFTKGDSLSYSKKVYFIVNIVDGKYQLNNNKIYSGNKIKKVSNIIEYMPEETRDNEIHIETQKHNKLRKALRLDGINTSNILHKKRNENENWYWDEPE
jgi:hypothetical protein